MAIRTAGVVIDCDRCGKEGVPADGHDDFYMKFNELGEDAHMFIGMFMTWEGEEIPIRYRHLCPKCQKSVGNLVEKILRTEKKEEKKPAKKAAEKKEKPKEKPAAEEPEPPVDAKTADLDEVSADELFAGMDG